MRRQQYQNMFQTHDTKLQDFRSLGSKQWDYRIAIKKAVEKLNSYLDLDSISTWPYRKGVPISYGHKVII